MVKKKIQLFISKSLSSFHGSLQEFKKLMKELEPTKAFTYKIIDIEADPDATEKYKIDAVPTILVDNVRLVGKLDAVKLSKIAQEIVEDHNFLANYLK